jgi:alpha-tubulin suppressor-like RCC1 family protein
MSVSLDKIVTQVNSKILSGGQDAIDTARLVGSVEALETRYSVANLAALPPAAGNTGRFIYVEDIAAYRYSDGTQWTNDYDTTTSIIAGGELFLWGNGTNGQLGDGTLTAKCSPVREICFATDWCQVSAASSGSRAIKTNGELWVWGSNGNTGFLGDGTSVQRCSPVREFCSATDWCSLAEGEGARSAAIKTSGQLWVWGGYRAGAYDVLKICSPVREFCSATDWCKAAVGYCHTLAIKTSGQLWAWGDGNCGRLGTGTNTSRNTPVRERCSATDWCSVSGGLNHSTAIKTTGQIWVWGRNYCGILGDGTVTDRCSPVREICSATDWCQVNAGGRHTAAIKTSGEVWAWGRNNFAQLGDGTTVDKCSPVREFCSATDWCQVSGGDGASAATAHTAAIKTSGELWSWGRNSTGQLGNCTATDTCSPVREISSSTNWCQVSAGYFHTAAIKAITKGFNEP